jgi:hypothetical protein
MRKLSTCREGRASNFMNGREIPAIFDFAVTYLRVCSYGQLERKLTPKERRRAVRLTAYEAEMAALHDAGERLQSRMEASYMQQRRFKHGIHAPRLVERREAHASHSWDDPEAKPQ